MAPPAANPPASLKAPAVLERPCCLRCVKLIGKDPTIICERPNKHQSCGRCRRLNGKCDLVSFFPRFSHTNPWRKTNFWLRFRLVSVAWPQVSKSSPIRTRLFQMTMRPLVQRSSVSSSQKRPLSTSASRRTPTQRSGRPKRTRRPRSFRFLRALLSLRRQYWISCCSR